MRVPGHYTTNSLWRNNTNNGIMQVDREHCIKRFLCFDPLEVAACSDPRSSDRQIGLDLESTVGAQFDPARG
jgi:hypothetical protein